MVEVELEGKTRKVDASGTIKDLMALLNITPEAYLSVLNGEVVTEYEDISPGDHVKFVKVWSRG